MNGRIAIFSILVAFILLSGCVSEVTLKADKAVEENNPALCKELEDEEKVDECYKKVADGLNDPEVCFQAKNRNSCLTDFSISKGNIKYCDMSTDAAAKYMCVATVMGDSTGRAIEDLIADWRSKGAVSKCKELCVPSYKACTSGCYSTFESEKAECAAKKDPGQRAYCEYEANKRLDRCYLGCYDIRDECEAGCMPKEE